MNATVLLVLLTTVLLFDEIFCNKNKNGDLNYINNRKKRWLMSPSGSVTQV